MTTEEVRRVRYTQVLKDPFPHHSSYQAFQSDIGLLGRAFKWMLKAHRAPEPISIWRAYQMGYDKAYEEMLAAADLVSTTRNGTSEGEKK